MNTEILGWALIIIGVIAILGGVSGGIAKLVKDIFSSGQPKSFSDLGAAAEFITALTSFLNALIRAPIWLALIIIGIFLIAWGGSLII
jgi:hypothetical protein